MDFKEKIEHLRQLIVENQYTKVLEEGELLLESYPEEIDLLLILAEAYTATDDYSTAEFHLLSANMQDEGHIETLLALGNIQILLQDYVAAQEYYEDVLAIEAENVPAQLAIGDLLYASSAYDAAVEKYVKVLEQGNHQSISPENHAILLARIVTIYVENAALEAAETTLEKYAPQAFYEVLELAKRQLYTARKAQQKVIATTTLLHENVPQKSKYIFELIELLDANTTRDSAHLQELYARLLELELDTEEKTRALLGLATLKIEEGDVVGGIQSLTELISNEENWFFYQKRAKAHELNKDKKAALQDWTNAIKLANEPYAPLYQGRGELLLKAGVYEKSIVDFKQVIKLSDGGEATAYYNLGIANNKMGDKTTAFKMLVQAEIMGHEKARALLVKSFSKQLGKMRQQKSAQFASQYEAEVNRNKQSPLLQKLFGQLWAADMSKFMQSIEDDLTTYPASVMRQVLAEAAKDLFLITPNGLLFIEGNDEPLEAYYSVEVESEHSILLHIQPTKGGNTSNMRLSFYERNLMVTYPVGGEEIPAKYYLPVEELKEEQRNTLLNKELDIPYLPMLEETIGQLVNL